MKQICNGTLRKLWPPNGGHRVCRPLGVGDWELLRKSMETDHTDVKPYVLVLASPA